MKRITKQCRNGLLTFRLMENRDIPHFHNKIFWALYGIAFNCNFNWNASGHAWACGRKTTILLKCISKLFKEYLHWLQCACWCGTMWCYYSWHYLNIHQANAISFCQPQSIFLSLFESLCSLQKQRSNVHLLCNNTILALDGYIRVCVCVHWLKLLYQRMDEALIVCHFSDNVPSFTPI